MSKYAAKTGRPFPFSDEQVEDMFSLWDSGKSVGHIASVHSTHSSSVRAVIERSGRTYERRVTRDKHYNWRGGRHVDAGGYVQVTPPPSWKFREEMCMGSGENHRRVMEHRMVMADFIDRPLLPSETVHHINGDKQDNRIENLQLRQGHHGVGVHYVCNSCGSQDVVPIKLGEQHD